MVGSSSRTLYDVLGIDEDADENAVKDAYKRMSRRCHPDKNLGNQQAVSMQQEVNRAFETLGDVTKRREYDRKLPRRRAPVPPRWQDKWGGYDGASGMASYAPRQTQGHVYAGHLSRPDQYGNGRWQWHEGSHPWRRRSFNLDDMLKEDQERSKREEEQAEEAKKRAMAEKRRADETEKQKLWIDRRLSQQGLLRTIIALDELIAGLVNIKKSQSSAGNREAYESNEGSDTIDQLSIILNMHRKELRKALSIHREICHLQRRNDRREDAEYAERELAKARGKVAVASTPDYFRSSQSYGIAYYTHPGLQALQKHDLQRPLDQGDLQRLQGQREGKDTPTRSHGPNQHVEGSYMEAELSEKTDKDDVFVKLRRKAKEEEDKDPKRAWFLRIQHWLDLVDTETEIEGHEGHSILGDSFSSSPTPSQGLSSGLANPTPKPLIPGLGVAGAGGEVQDGQNILRRTYSPPTTPRPGPSSAFVSIEPEPLVRDFGTAEIAGEAHDGRSISRKPYIPPPTPRLGSFSSFATLAPEPLYPDLRAAEKEAKAHGRQNILGGTDSCASTVRPGASCALFSLEPEPVVPDLGVAEAGDGVHDGHKDPSMTTITSYSPTPRPGAFHDLMELNPEPDISDPCSSALAVESHEEPNGEPASSHSNHPSVHGEFWDVVPDGEDQRCYYCDAYTTLLQCPRCTCKVCAECKFSRWNRGNYTHPPS